MFKNAFTRTGVIAITALALVGVSTASVHAVTAAGKVQCYLWADQESAALNTPYTPSTIFSFNAKHQAISVVHVQTGLYGVTCNGVGSGPVFTAPGGHVQVSSYGDGLNTFCHVGSWDTEGPDFFASVYCFGRGGGTGGGPAPADSKFDLLFIR